MARLLLIACLVSTPVVWLASTDRGSVPGDARSQSPDAPSPHEARAAPPGLLARIGTPVPANAEPPEFVPSLATFPTSPIKRIVFSADGRVMVTSGSVPGSTRIWNVPLTAPLAGIDHEDIGLFRYPCPSPDGRWVACGSDKRVAAWDGDTGAPAFWAPDPEVEPSSDRAIGFDRDGYLWTMDSTGGRITRRHLPSGDVVRAFDGQPQSEFAVVSANGARVAVGGTAFAVRSTDPAGEWHVVNSLLRRRPVRGSRPVPCPLAFSPDARLLVTGVSRGSYLTGTFVVWDVTERPVTVAEAVSGDSEWLTDMSFSPDGRWMAFLVESGGNVQTVRVWETATLTEAFRFAPEGMTAFAFHPDCRRLVTAHTDGTLALWDRAKVEAANGGVGAMDKNITITSWHEFAAVVLPQVGRLPKEGLPPTRGELVAALVNADPAARVDFTAALANTDPKVGLAAVHAVVAHPDAAVAVLREQFQTLTAAKAAELIAGLDDDDFAEREAASKELAELGERAEGAVRAAARSESPEVRNRAAQLLAAFVPVHGRLTTTHLRAGRAVEALERAGTPAAKELLAAWAASGANTYLGAEAKAALARLNAPR